MRGGENFAIAYLLLPGGGCPYFIDLVLNWGTSAQLCFAERNDDDVVDEELLPSIDSFSYFDNGRLLVAASLNGGNVVEAFVKVCLMLEKMCEHRLSMAGSNFQMLMQWSEQLTGNSSPPIDQVFCNVEALLLNKDAHCASAATNDDFRIVPTLFGERHDSASSASINGLKSGSLPDLSEVIVFYCGVIMLVQD